MRRWIVLAACLAAIGCSESSPVGPPPARTLVDLTWAGPTWLRVGETAQFQIIATWSDGTSEPVANAQWMSHNSKIVEMNSAGLATGIAEGLANLAVTALGTSRGGQLQVLSRQPQPVIVEGRVQMVAPSEHVVFPGVPVRIRSLTHYPFDSTATTDSSGRFFVTLEAGRYLFDARVPGDFFPSTESVTIVEGSRVILGVRPGSGAAIDSITLERGAPPQGQVTADYPIHRDGGFSFGLFRACFDDGCGLPATADVCVEVRDPDNRLFGQARLPVGSTRYEGVNSVLGGQVVTVKAYPCSAGAFVPASGVVFRELTLEVRRPK